MSLAVRRQVALGRVELGYHALMRVLHNSRPLNAPAVAFHIWCLAVSSRHSIPVVSLDVVPWRGHMVAVGRTVRTDRKIPSKVQLRWGDTQRARWARMYTRVVMASVDERRRRSMRWWKVNPAANGNKTAPSEELQEENVDQLVEPGAMLHETVTMLHDTELVGQTNHVSVGPPHIPHFWVHGLPSFAPHNIARGMSSFHP